MIIKKIEVGMMMMMMVMKMRVEEVMNMMIIKEVMIMMVEEMMMMMMGAEVMMVMMGAEVMMVIVEEGMIMMVEKMSGSLVMDQTLRQRSRVQIRYLHQCSKGALQDYFDTTVFPNLKVDRASFHSCRK